MCERSQLSCLKMGLHLNVGPTHHYEHLRMSSANRLIIEPLGVPCSQQRQTCLIAPTHERFSARPCNQSPDAWRHRPNTSEWHCWRSLVHMSAARVQEVSGRGHLSKAADVYSFGVLLWEMYHGMPPYVYCSEKKKLVNNRSFPRFDLRPREEAPFSFVVLSLACLSTEYDKRCVLFVGRVCLNCGPLCSEYLALLAYLSEQ